MRSLSGIVCLALLAAGTARSAVNVVVVEGLGGEERYTAQFDQQVSEVLRAARSIAPEERIRSFRVDEVSRSAVVGYFEELADEMQGDDQVIVYLIGHGSYDDHEYKFNLPGPDLTGADLAAALDKLPARNQVLVNTSSASGAGVEDWQHEDRVVIAATRSGVERHATKFGVHFVAALSSSSADIDKNNIITAREAFDFAERGVADYFDEGGQLATEHARLEGERADRFSLARLTPQRPAQDDALLRELTTERDAITVRIDELRLARDDMAPEQYQQELLENMLELATAEEAIETREREISGGQ